MPEPTIFMPLDIVFAKAALLGVRLPATVVATYERLRAVATSDGAGSLDAEALHARLAACIEAGDDPLGDPAILEEAARRHLSGGRLSGTLTSNGRELLITHGLEILDSFRPAFDHAADVLTDSRTTPDRAQQADGTITEIVNVWKFLGIGGAPFPWDGRHRLLVIVEVPSRWDLEREPFASGGAFDPKMSAQQAIKEGLTLDLATPDTLRQRVDAIRQTLADLEQQAAEAGRRQQIHQPQRSRVLTMAGTDTKSSK